MTPFEFVQYVALKQLDALAGDGVARTMAGFANIAEERDEYARITFQSYVEEVGEINSADWGEEAREQSLDYYHLLLDLRQSMLNLLAAGVYHLFEQHRDTLERLLKEQGRTLPYLERLDGWEKVDELRLLANTVKHADGQSARRLAELRPDLFTSPSMMTLPFHKGRPPQTVNPLGGTDLFVAETDIQNYRDAIRTLWEALRPVL
jgi:hypothetical protein